MALNKASILEAIDRQPVSVDVSEWGGNVLLAPMTGKQRHRLEATFMQKELHEWPDNYIASVLIGNIVDECGVQVFADTDAQKLAEKNGDVLQRLLKKLLDISGLGKESVEDAQKK